MQISLQREDLTSQTVQDLIRALNTELDEMYPEPGELKRMYVDPGLRGTGIGRRLVEALEAEARSLGATHLVLETGTRQIAALALYERCGFKPIPLYGEYCLSPETSICLGKSLDSGPP